MDYSIPFPDRRPRSQQIATEHSSHKRPTSVTRGSSSLNESVASHEPRTISHHRGSIRQLEREIWSINQMVAALNALFPVPGSAGELS